MGVVDRIMDLAKSFRSADPNRPEPEPRRGLFGFASALVQKKQQKAFVLNATTLDRLAKTDPVTWAILRTIKSRVNATKWDIVPDTEKIEKELDRWEEYAVEALNPFGLQEEPFKSKMLDDKLFADIAKKLDSVLKVAEVAAPADAEVPVEEGQPGEEQTDFGKQDEPVAPEDSDMADAEPQDEESTGVKPNQPLRPMTVLEKTKAIRWIFKMVKRRVVYEAEEHCEEVRRVFQRPNNSAETSLRALQELVLHDMLVFDAGIVVKNYSRAGRLAELYTIPGHQVKIYRNEDRTTPQPPEPAYVWEDNGIMRAEFTNEELIYIMQNPTQDGYGVSPLEVAAYIITASLYADQYNIDYFKNSNVPPGVFSLGKDITEEQRNLFQGLWDNEVQGRAGGLHRMLFMSGSEDPKFIPLQQLSNRDMQMMEYMRWTVAIKCACYGLSPQDIGFTDGFKGLDGGGVADTQKGLTDSRGINTILNLLEEYYNAEIVKSEFGFTDVKFQWQEEDAQDDPTQSASDISDIQQGVLSRNERRAKLGLKPIPGGDVVTITSAGGLVPVENLEATEERSLEEEVGVQQGGQADGAPEEGQGAEGEQGFPDDGGDQPQEDEGFGMAQKRAPVSRSVIKIVANRSNRGIGKKLDAAVARLRKDGVDAELRIGFKSDDTKK